MIQFTTKDIIKIIQLDEEQKKMLLAEYDSYDEGKKYEISSVCWNIFSEMTDKLTDIKYQHFIDEVEEGKRTLSPDIQDLARDVVHEEYRDILSGKKQDMQHIEEIRAKLQDLFKKS